MRKGNISKEKVNKKKNKGKHNIKLIKVLIYVVLITFGLSLIFLAGFFIYRMSTSSKYNVQKVEFVSNKIYKKEELEDVANVEMGKNLFNISKKDIETRLKTLPYIEEVDISVKLPDTLVIDIKEYVSTYLAYNKEQDKYYRLTKAGTILEEAKGEEKKDSELLLFGISFVDNVKFKDKIALTEIQKLEKFEKINELYVKRNIPKKITSVEFKEENVILTLDYDLNVILNDKDLDYDIAFLKSILEKLTKKAGTIDMTKNNPVFTESIR